MTRIGVIRRSGSRIFHRGLAVLFAGLSLTYTHAQCPPNLDFERGNFDNWTCYIGGTAAVDGQNVISLFPSPPVPGRHTMYGPGTTLLDPFGGFPVSCPNGSGYSIRLGNDLPGTEAEGVSYEFTIPAGMDVYSLIYHYAVVFQDPNHFQYQQPRMEIEILNVTDDKIIHCSSFTFIPFGSSLPGFFESPNPIDNTPVWCKDWSAVSISLDGNAGKTIRLSFRTADCTFRRHFGYAYIDVNTECSSEFVGATFCPDDTAINVTAPYGYQAYTWFNSDFSTVLGTSQTIRFDPPPPVGTTIAVEVVPYNGYGCLDTLYAKLIDTLTVRSNAGPDMVSCSGSGVQVGANPKPGLVYSWSPATGLSDPNIANPIANPLVTTIYTLTTRNNGGGCVDTDDVTVRASVIDNSISLVGKQAYCEGSGDSAVLHVLTYPGIQWFRDDAPITGANLTSYRAPRSGIYHAELTNADGCKRLTDKIEITIEKPRSGIIYPEKYAIVDLPLDLQARQFGATAVWKPPINLDNPNSYTPVFKGQEDQFYTIEITTASGCLTVDGQMVKVIPFADIYVPTAFTPNNDGLNDVLRPLLRGIKELKYFRVFNRWGQLIFETRSESPGWNGTLNGIPQGTQVLVWMAEGIGVDNNPYIRKGTTTLLR